MSTEKLVINSVDEILKLDPLEFVEIMKNQDNGFLSSVKNFIQMMYEQTNVTKDSMLALVHKAENMPNKDMEEAEEVLANLYKVMQILEDRHNIIKAILDERNKE